MLLIYIVAYPMQRSRKAVLLWWTWKTDHGACSRWSLWFQLSVLTVTSPKLCSAAPPSTWHNSIPTLLQIQWNLVYYFLLFPPISY